MPTTKFVWLAVLVTVKAGAALAVTVNVAVSHTVAFGAGAHTV